MENVTMFALGNVGLRLLVAVAWSFEEASGETEVGRRLLAPEPRSLPPLALALRTILQSSARVKKLAAALHSAAAMRPPAPRSANLYTLCPKSAVL